VNPGQLSPLSGPQKLAELGKKNKSSKTAKFRALILAFLCPSIDQLRVLILDSRYSSVVADVCAPL
jgi:hypothetical protein